MLAERVRALREYRCHVCHSAICLEDRPCDVCATWFTIADAVAALEARAEALARRWGLFEMAALDRMRYHRQDPPCLCDLCDLMNAVRTQEATRG